MATDPNDTLEGDTLKGAIKRKTSTDKIKELHNYLLLQRPKRQTKGQLEMSLNLDNLSSQLFARASIDFLERETLASLADITEHALSCLELLGQPDKPVASSAFSRPGSSAIIVALGDRPFIVNTITETLRQAGLPLRSLLHPILMNRSGNISLSFIETEHLPEDKLKALESTLTAALNDLILITEDFSPMLVRAETLIRVLDTSRGATSFTQIERRELSDFVRWLTEAGFIFLGHAEWRLGKADAWPECPTAALGLFRSPHSFIGRLIDECAEDAKAILSNDRLHSISKLRTASPVHRRRILNHIAIQEISSEGKVVSVHSFIGFLTSKALAQESSSIPLIRQKLHRVIEQEEVLENSFDYKTIVNIIDGMPEEDALRLSTDKLRELVRLIIDIYQRDEVRIWMSSDTENRGVSILVVLPRDRFNTHLRQKLQAQAEQVFKALPGSSEYHLDLTSQAHVRLYFYVPTAQGRLPQVDQTDVKQKLVSLSKGWTDRLIERLCIAESGHNTHLIEKYLDAFPDDYQTLQSVEDCLVDIKMMEKLSAISPTAMTVSQTSEADGQPFNLIVYNLGSLITISTALPILENAGLEVIQERSSSHQPTNSPVIYVHRFLVRPKLSKTIATDTVESVFLPGLTDVFLGKADNDALNSLLLEANLPMHAIRVLRTYCALLSQVNKSSSRETILRTLASYPQAATQIWAMFEGLFNPKLNTSPAQRRQQFEVQLAHFRDSLRLVTDITKDRILRSIAALLDATVRTNFYAKKATIALKIHSERVDIMPQPRPLYEIFVSSPSMEGVHLRGSRIARGGIRWSERPDDYRSEVLGLMKTQKIKNALIVPGGAKGGFIVKRLPTDPKAIGEAVKAAYQSLVRSLLELTDNRVGEAVQAPAGLVIYDEPDPYLVVAADKGTAAFSDVANKLATEEFNFWLGDAFASGGSNGYDHKLYAITAKGAWECVTRHFNDLGFNFNHQPFSVIGIGDMSGDVFGNGLLLSRNIKLIAAFNHKHVMIDPSPDLEKSFTERKRLFDMPGSQWSDYNPQLISSGGGVFGRYDKEIKLSPEMRAALSLPDDTPATVNGEQLVNLVMRAKCDLLWNGGIGTYVKASFESHAEVNDGSNERVRINSDELRARVVAEGGNLGFTQRARIEFAQLGGAINTDAIDNSGGVDLSDHEVNLKILFAGLLRDKKLTLEERNKLLKEMAPEVVTAVLDHNRSHALHLTLGLSRSRRNIGYFQSLIREVARHGYINRSLEFLPDDDELAERAKSKAGLTRPELAILIAAVKMYTKDVLLGSDLTKEPLLKTFLIEYFPHQLQERFKTEILAHPLSANIIATQIANYLVDAMGVTFVQRMCMNHGVSPLTVITCSLAAELIVGFRSVRQGLAKYDTFADARNFRGRTRELNDAFRLATAWLIRCHGDGMSVGKLVELYANTFPPFFRKPDAALTKSELAKYQERLAAYTEYGVEVGLSKVLAPLPWITSVFETLWTAREHGKDVALVGQALAHAGEILGISDILTQAAQLDVADKWESETLLNAIDEIRRSLSNMCGRLLKRGNAAPEMIAEQLRSAQSYERLKLIVDEVKSNRNSSVAAFSVIAKQLRTFQVS